MVTDTDPPLLAQPSPDSIQHLFDADPATLTDDDFTKLIIELRRRRSAFLSEEAATQAAGKAKRPAKGSPTAGEAAALNKPLAEVSLEDLMKKGRTDV